MIAIIDYGVGNLYSISHSLSYLGLENAVTRDGQTILNADKLILPGVGAFGDARQKLRDTGMDTLVLQKAAAGTPLLGICLGMQLLFEKSYEYGEHAGLGLLKGRVVDMNGRIPENLMIPHIGWNGMIFKRKHKLLRYLREGDCVYFVHSFYAEDCEESLIATAEYGRELTAIVAKDNVMGCQFHPEKSGEVGLNILRAFCEEDAI
jgi:glutamine amidotransferase